ncbi:MAG: hypothetical protein Q8Q18_02000 [bacterium]|nr:hypothetical protein [bacterium]
MNNSFLFDIKVTWPPVIDITVVWWLFWLLTGVTVLVAIIFSFHLRNYAVSRFSILIIEIVFYAITTALLLACYFAAINFGL